MEKSKTKIQVRDVRTQQILFECALTESEKAYQFAAEMEEMGLDLEVIAPTLGETLSNSLGLTQEQQQEYKNSIEDEMEAHEGSCCFKDPEDKTTH
jgi:protein-arginine kinase